MKTGYVMDCYRQQHFRKLALVALARAALALARGLVLLTLGVTVGLLLGTALVGTLSFWAVWSQAHRVVTVQRPKVGALPVVDAKIVGIR